MRILVLNGGSSSFKCWFADLPEGKLPSGPPQPQWSARVEWSRDAGTAAIKIKRSGGATVERKEKAEALVSVLESVLESLWSGAASAIQSPAEIDVVGHRVVHGGPKYRDSIRLTPEVRAAIAREVEFAPVHNRFELEAVETVDRVVGAMVLQIGVFDTGFHKTLRPAAYVYPGPYAWLEQGIRRYGFHGINHQYASRRAAEILERDLRSLKLIVCHLGSGASLAAVREGMSVDTTMGFTPLEGLMMSTRSGSIDPGILVYLIRHCNYTAEQLDRLLNHESGLLGVSGLSGDMREIVRAMDDGNERARLAFDIYVHRLTREIGAMLGVLGGVDAIVFTGGVGENSADIRRIVCERFGFLGLKLDPARNAGAADDQDIAAADSTVRVLMIRAEEEWEIARECRRLADRSA
jgi:acetate kinase